MNKQQIATIYDGFTEDQQDMPREQFIKKVFDALDSNKMMAEAQSMAEGRIRKRVIDDALRGDSK